MRSFLRCVIAALAASALAVLASCDDGAADPPPGGPGTGGGAGTPYDGGTSDADGGGGGTSADAGDAGVTPVLVGVTPSPRSDDGEPTAGDRLEAELTTFAVGVRAVVVTRALRDLQDDAAWAALDALGDLYAAHDKRVLFDLTIVDRAADGRPAPLDALAWDDPAVALAVHQAIDGVLARFGGQLSYLALGRDVDVYLADHPDERAAFEALAAGACAHASGSPAAPEGLRVGVGFSFDGAGADPSFAPLLDAGDVAVLSHVPGRAAGQAAPASTVAGALDAMTALAGGRPVVLRGVGYPSSLAAGGSEEKQRLFFRTLFDALAPRRAAFELINVVELHDPAPAACDAYAVAQGEPSGGPFASFSCSLGLFDQGATARPAWLEVASGAAAFATP
ncbi:MAG: hypothetical protein IT372_29695 [Polyangiaceae bacterium]|nr:hypothetical protein [Polyangiaceae bacterium]